jgi:hypothetical protein
MHSSRAYHNHYSTSYHAPLGWLCGTTSILNGRGPTRSIQAENSMCNTCMRPTTRVCGGLAAPTYSSCRSMALCSKEQPLCAQRTTQSAGATSMHSRRMSTYILYYLLAATQHSTRTSGQQPLHHTLWMSSALRGRGART